MVAHLTGRKPPGMQINNVAQVWCGLDENCCDITSAGLRPLIPVICLPHNLPAGPAAHSPAHMTLSSLKASVVCHVPYIPLG